MHLASGLKEGMQLGVSALSFVHFCHAIFEDEVLGKEDWWIGSEPPVQVFFGAARTVALVVPRESESR